MQVLWLMPARLLCRGLDPEEPIVSTANLCTFNHLEVTVRMLACRCLCLCPHPQPVHLEPPAGRRAHSCLQLSVQLPSPSLRPPDCAVCIPGWLEHVCPSHPASTCQHLHAS